MPTKLYKNKIFRSWKIKLSVIHSFAIPALGVKCDAYPGRLNQFSVLINRLGTFYGLNHGQNCSEPTVINHQIDGKALKES